jgi:hypothetical protein
VNEGNLFFNVLRGYAEDLTKLCGGGISAGDTKISLGLSALGESGGIVVTASVSAGSAVCTGKLCTYIFLGLVLGNTEKVRYESEKYSGDKADATNYRKGE